MGWKVLLCFSALTFILNVVHVKPAVVGEEYGQVVDQITNCNEETMPEVVDLVSSQLRVLVQNNDKTRLAFGKRLATLCIENCPERPSLVASCWHNLGYVLFQLHESENGDLAEAYSAFEKAVSLQPELVDGYGMLLNMHGKFSETLRVLEDLGQVKPATALIYAKGELYLEVFKVLHLLSIALCEHAKEKCVRSLEILHKIETSV